MYARASLYPWTLLNKHSTARGAGAGASVNSFWAVGAQMARSEGALSLMNGLTASMLREASYSGIRMGTYDLFKDAFSGLGLHADGLTLKVLAATVASTLGSCVHWLCTVAVRPSPLTARRSAARLRTRPTSSRSACRPTTP
jgi:hypothetical protein